MQTREWITIDKSVWQRGAWDDEADKMQWQDGRTGFPCLIVRNAGGALCGYVGVPDSHLWHGIDYDECPNFCKDRYCNHRPVVKLSVHDEITFSDICQPGGDEQHTICHVPDKSEPDNIWWFGFDCAHYGDMSPANTNSVFSGTYRNVAYVKEQIANLAKQLKAIN